MKEGETQLTLTPFKASSIAADLVTISRPALDIQYEIMPGWGTDPFKQETFITDASPHSFTPCIKRGLNFFINKYGTLVLTMCYF